MFEDHMKTPAIPDRIFALCKAVKNKNVHESELKEQLEPSHLGGSTPYFGNVKAAAQQLGLISIKENVVSLAVEKQEVDNIQNMRTYIIKNIAKIKYGLFYTVTREYFNLDDKVLQYNSVSDRDMVDYMSNKTGCKVFEDDMRAWRFWGSFLGFGYLHEMLLLPNMYSYLENVISIVDIKKEKEYSFCEFIEMINPYCEMALYGSDSERKLNFAISNGLRALHDNGIITLQHKLDSGDMWYLYPSELHIVKSTVTSITIRG